MSRPASAIPRWRMFRAALTSRSVTRPQPPQANARAPDGMNRLCPQAWQSVLVCLAETRTTSPPVLSVMQVSCSASLRHRRSAIDRARFGLRLMFESCKASKAIRLWRFTMSAEILWSALRSRILVRSHSRRSAFAFFRRDAETLFARARKIFPSGTDSRRKRPTPMSHREHLRPVVRDGSLWIKGAGRCRS